jgi:hypothetical protein
MALVSYIRLGKNIERCTRRATMRYVRRMLHRELEVLKADLSVIERHGSTNAKPSTDEWLMAKIEEVRSLIVQFGGRP